MSGMSPGASYGKPSELPDLMVTDVKRRSVCILEELHLSVLSVPS